MNTVFWQGCSFLDSRNPTQHGGSCSPKVPQRKLSSSHLILGSSAPPSSQWGPLLLPGNSPTIWQILPLYWSNKCRACQAICTICHVNVISAKGWGAPGDQAGLKNPFEGKSFSPTEKQSLKFGSSSLRHQCRTQLKYLCLLNCSFFLFSLLLSFPTVRV